MYRIKLGESTTISNVTKGPKIVLECEQINELVDMIACGIVDHLIETEENKRPDARTVIKRL